MHTARHTRENDRVDAKEIDQRSRGRRRRHLPPAPEPPRKARQTPRRRDSHSPIVSTRTSPDAFIDRSGCPVPAATPPSRRIHSFDRLQFRHRKREPFLAVPLEPNMRTRVAARSLQRDHRAFAKLGMEHDLPHAGKPGSAARWLFANAGSGLPASGSAYAARSPPLSGRLNQSLPQPALSDRPPHRAPGSTFGVSHFNEPSGSSSRNGNGCCSASGHATSGSAQTTDTAAPSRA